MKAYLGDSVYVDITEWGEVLLTTENGMGPSNQIIMDGSVLSNFEEYIASLRKDKTEFCSCADDWTDGTAYCQACHKVRNR